MTSKKQKKLAAIAAVVSSVVGAVLAAQAHGIFIIAMHMDGAFQTSSMLYRLSFGDLPGRDFFPYLGLGPLFALYPTFLLMGSTVSAAISSAYLLTYLVYAASVTLICALFFNVKSYQRLAFLFSVFLSISWPLSAFINLRPGNSLRPLRCAVPGLCVGLLLIVWRHIPNKTLRYFLCGVLAGVGLIWSNDYGIPTFIVIVALTLLEIWSRRDSFLSYPFLLIGFLLSSSLLLTSLTAGHPLALLHYNFYDVAGDQFWYFGNDQRSFRMIELRDLIILLEPTAFILVASSLLFAIPRRCYVVLVALGWAYFMGGILATIGGHYEPGYFEAFNSWQWLVILLLLLRGAQQLSMRFFHWLIPQRVRALYFLWLAALCSLTVFGYSQRLRFAKANGFYVPEIGGYLASDQASLVAFARSSKDPLLEEYWGLTSAIRRQRGPWSVDSAIAALGSQRSDAERILHNWKGVVATTRIGGLFLTNDAHMCQAWSVNENWWLYSVVLQNYKPLLVTPNIIFWKKMASPTKWPETPCSVSNNPEQSIQIGGEDGYYDISLEYVLNSKRWHASIMAETNTAMSQSDTYGFISINPRATHVRLPAYISHALPPNLLFQVYPEDLRKDFLLRSCSARRILDYPPDVLSQDSSELFTYFGTRETHTMR